MAHLGWILAIWGDVSRDVSLSCGVAEPALFGEGQILMPFVRRRKDCFTPKYERMKRYHGQWHREERPMFPGYLFFITDRIDEIHYEQKRLPQLTKILGTGAEFIPLSEKEVEMLAKIEELWMW